MREVAKIATRFALAIVLGVVLLGLSSAQTNTSPDLAVIVNPNNAVDSLRLNDLAKIYRGERQYWKGNLPIVLLFRTPGSYEREVALRVVFQMTDSQYKQYWVSKIMRAEATAPPAELFSGGMTKEGVMAMSGAIGCISATEIRPGMKVLRIDGHLPGEAGYPLH